MAIRAQLCPISSAVLLALGWTSSAHAQLAQNLLVDPVSLTMGNAVTADPPGVSAVHFNPAALTKIEGVQLDTHVALTQFQFKKSYAAPAGYNVFGYSDDPLVCNDAANNPSKLCTDFKQSVEGKVEFPSVYVPVLKDFVDLPDNSPLPIPLGGAAYKAPGSKIAFGTAFYLPIGGAFGASDNNPSNYMGQRLDLKRISYLTPSIAYKVNDKLSLGASIGMSYQDIALQTDMRVPNDMLGVIRMIDEDVCTPFKDNGNIITDMVLLGMCNANESLGPFKKFGRLELAAEQTLSPSFNVGLQWEPTEKIGFGLVYQSPSKTKMKGSYSFANSQGLQDLVQAMNASPTGQIAARVLGLPSSVSPTETGHVSMDLTYPAHIQAGVKLQLHPKLKVNFDLGWTDFKQWDSLKFNFDRVLPAFQVAKLLSSNATETSVAFPTKFQSPWSWGVGIELSPIDRLKLRVGYQPRYSAIPDDRRSPMLPLNNMQLIGAGLSYQLSKNHTIDLSAMQMSGKDQIPAGTSSLGNLNTINNVVYNPYAGLNMTTKSKVTILGLSYRIKF